MKSKKVEKVDLPYASTVASFYGDQGGAGNSFLGRMFGKSGGRQQVVKNFAPASPAGAPARVGSVGGLSNGGQRGARG